VIKKFIILFTLILVLLALLSLWVFDKILILRGRGSSFSFFSPPPRPLNKDTAIEPLALPSLSRSA
jgi:hypothetical protein